MSNELKMPGDAEAAVAARELRPPIHPPSAQCGAVIKLERGEYDRANMVEAIRGIRDAAGNSGQRPIEITPAEWIEVVGRRMDNIVHLCDILLDRIDPDRN